MHPQLETFEPGIAPPAQLASEAKIFLYSQQQVGFVSLAHKELPNATNLFHLSLASEDLWFFGHWDGAPCYAWHLPQHHQAWEQLEWERIRALYEAGPLFWVANRGHHLAHWHATHAYCGRCGTPMEASIQELARHCIQCSFTVYPRISPAVIMAVTRGREILLGKINRPGVNLYSVLAGFVEPGESLEACVAREVQEETGITVKNVRYFGSQPWAFPDQLMVGFTAEYGHGEITLDDELEDAGWFAPEQLPNIPPKPSIARALIDDYLSRNR